MSARRAAVIGGGPSGLCAVAALAPSFDHVYLVERGELSSTAKGSVPQARHPHLLLARGRQALEELLPGFHERMATGGALDLDESYDIALCGPMGWLPRIPTGVRQLYASRTLLDDALRGLIGALANVTIWSGTEVRGLVFDRRDGRDRLTGVVTRSRAGADQPPLAVDLVVDATGRGDRCVAWLSEAGIAPPHETVVDIDLGYATRWYRRSEPPPAGWWWKGALFFETSRSPSCVLFPVEDDQFLVNIAGRGDRAPPTEEAGFLAELEKLPTELALETVRRSTPTSRVYGYRVPQSRLRHFERWRRAPAGFLALGDSVCTFNPNHGQGISVAAVAATLLKAHVGTYGPDDPALPAHFFRAQRELIRDPWRLSSGTDLWEPGTVSNAGPSTRLAGGFCSLLWAAGAVEPSARRQLARFANMMTPLSDSFRLGAFAELMTGLVQTRRALRTQGETSPLPPIP
jgi:2-polyprenyl-6-methoxyphenol hydroxylase-like FAD-dependent oxidoreductase